MYLIDTNVLILGLLKHEPEFSFLKKAIETNQIALSTITISEYLSKASNDEEAELNKLIAVFPVHEVDLETAKIAASYRKKFIKTKRVHLLDCLIAAQAKKHKLILITNNGSDFPMKDIQVKSPD